MIIVDLLAGIINLIDTLTILMQVKEVMLRKNNENESLLFLAVRSKSPEMFNTVMACVDDNFDPQEVRK